MADKPKIDQAVDTIMQTIAPRNKISIVEDMEANGIVPSNINDLDGVGLYNYADQYIFSVFYDKLSHFIPIDEED